MNDQKILKMNLFWKIWFAALFDKKTVVWKLVPRVFVKSKWVDTIDIFTIDIFTLIPIHWPIYSRNCEQATIYLLGWLELLWKKIKIGQIIKVFWISFRSPNNSQKFEIDWFSPNFAHCISILHRNLYGKNKLFVFWFLLFLFSNKIVELIQWLANLLLTRDTACSKLV